MLQSVQELLEKALAEKEEWFQRAINPEDDSVENPFLNRNLIHESLEDLSRTVKRMMHAVTDGSSTFASSEVRATSAMHPNGGSAQWCAPRPVCHCASNCVRVDAVSCKHRCAAVDERVGCLS